MTIPTRGFQSLASAQQALVQALAESVKDGVSGQDMGLSYVFSLPTNLDTRQKLEASLRAAGIDAAARLLRRSNPERRRSDRV